MNNQEAGLLGENLAAKLIEEKGYKILERNYRFGKGEIDIIAKTENVLVFIEVKTRTNLEYGPPELAVTKSKQSQIRRIAQAYLNENNTDCESRLDVIAILLKKDQPEYINHIENAF
ncbi:MAG: YraN family protein [Melioribacteraceae bacterium]|nr:YraN family protein [Melioribacteraceae bacterium]MCF8264691.1 YraN family protein [Melioribacteraceae bacterium]MCF8412231.1 YraN family protein [Melioribacteraceae bacterium]MCF8431862.1 YraN family protein [Melioribacteraceae bacterium]